LAEAFLYSESLLLRHEAMAHPHDDLRQRCVALTSALRQQRQCCAARCHRLIAASTATRSSVFIPFEDSLETDR
jgi:hypothetical protein